jgi:ATP-binding cassette subfamily G (WHITE) protein 2 (SNQ2)
MWTILVAPLSFQIQIPFLRMRDVYEIRERPSRMYSWTALITSQLLAETPWNIIGSSLFFLSWYWTIGMETSRIGYMYLLSSFLFPIYYTSMAQATAAMVSSAELAALVFGFFLSFSMIL